MPIDLLILGVAGVLPLIAAWQRTKETTLRAPVAWVVISWFALLAGEWAARSSAEGPAATWRYLAAASTACPSMALLGAKRPQDRGWQFIVASLWLVLALPALQMLVLTPSGMIDPHPAWRALWGILILVGVSNHLPTRFGWAAVATGIAQWQLVKFHAMSPSTSLFASPLIPLGLLAAVILGVAAQVQSRAGQRTPREDRGWNRVWRDFRDAYGCVWALRVAERINHASRLAGMHTRLSWQGFEEGHAASDVAQSPPISPSTEEDLRGLEVTAHQLLRRFVNPEWIKSRLEI